VRLRLILAAAAVAIFAAAIVFAVLVVTADSGEARSPTRAEYIARVNAVCRVYNVRLAKIPAPVAVGNPQAVAQSVGQALPLVVERAEKVRAIKPPQALAGQVGRMFALSDRAVRELRIAYRESRANKLLKGDAALGRFLGYSDRAKEVARKIGLSC
jgi:hypothetical protein